MVTDANSILDFLKEVNELSSSKITQKWIFVDLFYLLYRHVDQISKINVAKFAKTYLAFEEDRRKHNAEPEKLLAGKAAKGDTDLYAYIIAFKIAGGERSNIKQRVDVIERRFQAELGIS